MSKIKEVIVCAACKLSDGTILCGARHWDGLMNAQYKAIKQNNQDIKIDHSAQGFVNQWGEYKDRVEALSIVKTNGQPFNQERNGATDELYSEGIY